MYRVKRQNHKFKAPQTNTDWQKNCKQNELWSFSDWEAVMTPSTDTKAETLCGSVTSYIHNLTEMGIDLNIFQICSDAVFFFPPGFMRCCERLLITRFDGEPPERRSKGSARKTQTCAGALQQMAFPLQWRQCRDNGRLYRSEDKPGSAGTWNGANMFA